MLFESILCAVLYVFFKCFDYQLGTLYAFRPIVVCPVVGAFLGDLNTGLVMGASIEALFMGSVSIGAIFRLMPPRPVCSAPPTPSCSVSTPRRPSALPCPSVRSFSAWPTLASW